MMFPPGFRFRPTDEHILEHYLPRWSAGEALHPSLVGVIREAQFYGENEPDKIYEDMGIPSELRDGELYFFTLVKKKFGDTSCKDSKYMERVAGRGAWRGQNSREVFNASNEFIGYKTTLNFQINKRNLNPSWIMHEYIMPNHQHHDRFWAFCKVKRGTTGCKNKNKTPLLVESSTADADLCYPNNKKPRYSADSQERIHPQPFMPPRNLLGGSEASTSYASPVPTTSDILQGVQVTTPGAYEYYPTPTCLTHHEQHPLQPCTQITDQEASQPATQSPPTLPPSAETLPRVTEPPCSPDFFDGLPNLDNIPIPDDLLDYHGWSQIIVEEDFAMDFDLADSGQSLVT